MYLCIVNNVRDRSQTTRSVRDCLTQLYTKNINIISSLKKYAVSRILKFDHYVRKLLQSLG